MTSFLLKLKRSISLQVMISGARLSMFWSLFMLFPLCNLVFLLVARQEVYPYSQMRLIYLSKITNQLCPTYLLFSLVKNIGWSQISWGFSNILIKLVDSLVLFYVGEGKNPFPSILLGSQLDCITENRLTRENKSFGKQKPS